MCSPEVSFRFQWNFSAVSFYVSQKLESKNVETIELQGPPVPPFFPANLRVQGCGMVGRRDAPHFSSLFRCPFVTLAYSLPHTTDTFLSSK